jgi:hypothetical protein
MRRRDALTLAAIACLPRCGAVVFPEEPLSDRELVLVNSLRGMWYGRGDSVLIEGTSYPGGDVRTAWWQLRFERVSVRRIRMNWSRYLGDIEAPPFYELRIENGIIVPDSTQRIRSMVGDSTYERHSVVGSVLLSETGLEFDVTQSVRFLGPNTFHLERRRFTVNATRNRP